MGWNNYGNHRDTGYGGNYNSRGSYHNDHYSRNNRDYYEEQPKRQFLYKRGQKCVLKANPKIVVHIIRIGREQYECRLPDLRTEWFYEDELMLAPEDQY